MPVPVVLDCDPGHDDAFALWLALGDPGIELRAVTTVGGNGQLAHTTRNARVVCTVAGERSVPIGAGADAPLLRALHPADWIHGVSALDGPEPPEPEIGLDPRGAVALLRDTLLGAPEPVTLVATGPLTNIALLARLHPDALAAAERIVWMGGSTGRGNVTPYAEFNSWVDPEAVAVVLGTGVRFTMVGLNVTHQALVTPEVLAGLVASGTRTAAFGAELLAYYRASYRASQGLENPPLHDPVAMALVADPSLVSCVRARLDVEVHGTETAGATSVDLRGTLGRPPNVEVAVELDAPRFWARLADALRALA
ncbi:MAG TPA: nucleoside hydrolase [Pseudonocardia sp.]|jgi:purine nucleosidase/pyrimidine-specific ribonucleoside hydrolase